MARGRGELLAGLLTGALLGASLAMSLAPGGDGTRERLRALARSAEERLARETPLGNES